MPGVSRVGVDTAGGVITGPGCISVFVNGAPTSVLGDTIKSHGDSPHSSAKMVGSSVTVFAGGLPICREGDDASCGHTATGSADVFSG